MLPRPKRITAPLAVTLAVLLAAPALLGGCAREPEPRTDLPGTSVGREVVDVVRSTTTVLSGVENLPSAREAEPRLGQLESRLDALTARAADLPRPAQEQLSLALNDVMPAMIDQVDRVQEIPGVPGTLRPILDRMRTKLQAMRVTDGEVPDRPYATPR